MKTTLALVGGIVLSGALLASTAAPIQKLYVLHAKQAKITKSNGQYQIAMKTPVMSYFTDRPARAAGKVKPANFVAGWNKGNNSFAKDHPNAALVADIDFPNGKTEAMDNFVQLSNPVYSQKAGMMTMDVALLKKTDRLQTGVFDNVILFIDNACHGAYGGVGTISCGWGG